MENTGFIKLYRALLGWEWYNDIPTKVLFLHILLKANYKEKSWRGIVIKRGELLTGRKILSDETGLSEQQVRTSINKLKRTGEITIIPTSKFSIIKLNNYEKYNIDNQQEDSSITNEQPTTNQLITTTKKDNNIKKEKNINKEKMSLLDFDEFWSLYPRKVRKKDAQKKFLALDLKVKSALITGLEKHINMWKAENTEICFIPHPVVWINQERWNDEVNIKKDFRTQKAEELKKQEEIEKEKREKESARIDKEKKQYSEFWATLSDIDKEKYRGKARDMAKEELIKQGRDIQFLDTTIGQPLIRAMLGKLVTAELKKGEQ